MRVPATALGLGDPLATAQWAAGTLLVVIGGAAVLELLLMRAVEAARALAWRRDRPYRYGRGGFLRRLAVWGLVCWTGVAVLDDGAGWPWLLAAWGAVLAVAATRLARAD